MQNQAPLGSSFGWCTGGAGSSLGGAYTDPLIAAMRRIDSSVMTSRTAGVMSLPLFSIGAPITTRKTLGGSMVFSDCVTLTIGHLRPSPRSSATNGASIVSLFFFPDNGECLWSDGHDSNILIEGGQTFGECHVGEGHVAHGRGLSLGMKRWGSSFSVTLRDSEVKTRP
jgi:hypothetical protein